MNTCGTCGTKDGHEWWSGKQSGFVCENCGLQGKAKVTAEEIRTRIAARTGASTTRTKSDGPNQPSPALAAVTRAAELLAVAMRAVPEPPETMLSAWKELWNSVWRLAGVEAPPLTAAVTGGKGGQIPGRSFDPMKGLETAEKAETGGASASGRKAFVPFAGIEKAAEPDLTARPPRFTVGA